TMEEKAHAPVDRNVIGAALRTALEGKLEQKKIDEAVGALMSATGQEDEAELARELEAYRFLVEDPEVDARHLREHLERTAQGVPGTMYVTLMHTVRGNLAWMYCFQNGSPELDGMTAKTVKATLDLILRKVDEAATPKLVVRYFLREPTTSK